jgi:hypothetical protein
VSSPAPETRLGARRAAQHELSKSIYHRNSEPFPVRAVHWVSRLIDRVLDDALKHSPGGSLGALALVIVIVAFVIVVIWRVGLPQRNAAVGVVLAAGSEVSAAEHRERSEAAASSGDWQTAVVERMRAVARELEERGILDRRAGRTAIELAKEAGNLLPLAAEDLRGAAEAFNHVAYGGGGGSRTTLALVISADDGVRRSSRTEVLAS